MGNGIGIAVDRTGNRQSRILEGIASPGIVDILSLVRVSDAGGCREPGRQSNRGLSEHGAAASGYAWVEPALEWSRRLIAPEGLVIRFTEEKHAAHPGQSGLLVRDRDFLGHLMLKVELVRPYQVELGAVGIRDELVVQRPKRRQADQCRSGRQHRRQTGACTVVQRVTPGE